MLFISVPRNSYAGKPAKRILSGRQINLIEEFIGEPIHVGCIVRRQKPT